MSRQDGAKPRYDEAALAAAASAVKSQSIDTKYLKEMDEKRGAISALSQDSDLDTDFVHMVPLQRAKICLKADLPSKQEEVFDSGISSIAPTSITYTRSDSSEPLDTSVSKALSPFYQDEGICSFPSNASGSLKGNLESSEKNIKNSDVEKIIPELAKKLNVQDSLKEDGGYYSFPVKSTDSQADVSGNLNDTELDVEEILAEPDEDGDTLIHTAIVSRDETIAVELIDLLTSHTKCLDIANKLFQTPLHLAVLTKQRAVVQKLVAMGCNLSIRDQQGNTALHIACREGSDKLVKDMVGAIAENISKRKDLFSLKNCEGLTCLHLASQGKHYEIMGFLFARGADVNIGDAKSGRTVLHYAVERRDVETVVVLLTHPSIDVDCETYKGETPLLLAYWRNYQDIVKRLKANGAFFSYDLVENDDEGDDS